MHTSGTLPPASHDHERERGGGAGDRLAERILARLGKGETFPSPVLRRFSSALGAPLGGVRLHRDPEAAALASSVQARAFTVGADVFFGAGAYEPDTLQGTRLLGHELAHTVQQHAIDTTAGRLRVSSPTDRDEVLAEGASRRLLTAGGQASPLTASETSFGRGPAPTPGVLRVVRDPLDTGARGGVVGGDFRFNVKLLSPDELHALAGIAPSALPEGVVVQVPDAGSTAAGRRTGNALSQPSILAPAAVGASYFSPTPFSFLPSNSTGVLWTQGHTSVFANPQGALFPTLRGYRGNLLYYVAEMLPGVGSNFTIRLHEGVPGSFRNDAVFPLTPGQQSYLYVLRDADEAARFADTLRGKQYGGQYTYSPPRSQADPILGGVGRSEVQMYEILVDRGRAPMCTNNCITVPSAEIEGATGMRPTARSGVDVMTGRGPEGVDPHHAGRGRLMTEAMGEGPLAPGVQRLNIRVTPGGSASMFLIRRGGRVLLVYGLYQTEERIRASVGTDRLTTVVAEESGAWAGGILGAALGGAAAGAILCAPTGPVDAVCVVGGFVGGLLFGAVGGTVGSELGHTAVQGRTPEGGVLDTVTAPVIRRAGELHNYLEYNIRQLYGVPF